MVICLGEFGRTPKVNTRGGRDHWPGAMSVLFAGGDVHGAVCGATMTRAITPLKMFTAPRILLRASTKLGINPNKFSHRTGRLELVDGGTRIKELFA